MNCKHCGFVSNNGEKFCRNCGSLLETSTPSNMSIYNQGQAPSGLGSNSCVNSVNNVGGGGKNDVGESNAKKWAILSVVVPIVGIIWYWFIGLSFYLAVLIASCGLGFAKKGELADKRLSMIGKIASGVLIGMAMIMFVLYIMGLV